MTWELLIFCLGLVRFGTRPLPQSRISTNLWFQSAWRRRKTRKGDQARWVYWRLTVLVIQCTLIGNKFLEFSFSSKHLKKKVWYDLSQYKQVCGVLCHRHYGKNLLSCLSVSSSSGPWLTESCSNNETYRCWRRIHFSTKCQRGAYERWRVVSAWKKAVWNILSVWNH